MALFNRKKKDSVLPEVDQYYEAERRDRSGLAWLLALASILIVALILVGLFLGGRWAYNKVTEDSSDEPETSDVAQAPSFDGAMDSTDESSSDDSAQDAEDQTPATPETDDEEDQTNEGTVQAPARTDTPSTPPVASENSELPNTGPANLLGVFAGVSTLAGGVHYTLQRRKQDR